MFYRWLVERGVLRQCALGGGTGRAIEHGKRYNSTPVGIGFATRTKDLQMGLPKLTEAQAKALAGGPFAAELLKNAVGYTVPIGWVVSGSGSDQQVTNGTAFFVRTPK